MDYPVFNDEFMNKYDQMTPEERKNFGAVWTPPEIISQMMAKVSEEHWTNPNYTCLDPTCGSGNIVVCMLLNKLYHGVSPEMAVKNTYGIELQQKNVDICRDRICAIVGEKYRKIVEHNIVCSDIFLWNIDEWRSIQRKRYYIQEYFKNIPDIHDYIMIDDDILDGKIWLIDGQRLVHQPIKNLLGAMCYAYLHQDNRTYAGPNSCEIGWGHWNSMPTKKFTTNQSFYQIFFVNNDYIRNGGVRFRDLESFGEDCILYFDISESNQQVTQFPWVKFAFYKDSSVNYSIASNDLEGAKVVINTIRIMGNKAIPQHSSKSKKYALFTKYKKGKTINPYWNEIEPILIDDSKSYTQRRNEIINIVDKYNKVK